MLTETERQFYLAAAGIRLWYARDPLPGAAPSPEFVFLPEAEPEPVACSTERPRPSQPLPETSGPAPVAVPPSLRALISGEDAEPGPAPVPQTTGRAQVADTDAVLPQADTPVAAAEVPAAHPLALQVWAGRRFALVTDVSADTSLKLQENLARNILISIGERKAESYGPVHWPVFNNLAVAGSRPEDLLAIIRDLLAPVAGHSLLLVGLADMGGSGDAGDWLVRAGDYDAALVFPHSLAELAGQPGLKRSLWQQLKALVVD